MQNSNTVRVYGVKDAPAVDKKLFGQACVRYGLETSHTVTLLAYGDVNTVGREIRHYYFDPLVGDDGRLDELRFPKPGQKMLDLMTRTRIFSYGRCNVQCPYCKRDCQFVDDQGNPILSLPVKFYDLFRMAEGAVSRNEVVRFSGGDPVMYPKETLAISWYLRERYGAKTSIAHNGSGTKWVKELLPFLDSAAIDLKAAPDQIGEIMGISKSAGATMYRKSLETQALFSNPETNPNGAILDVRTPLFGHTTLEDMRYLANDVCKGDPGLIFWTWRLYKEVNGCTWAVPDKERVIEMLKIVSAEHPTHWMGIRAKWHGGGMMYFRDGELINPGEELDTVEKAGSGNDV